MSSAIFDVCDGTLPLLVSVPHDGRRLPDDVAARMSPAGRDLPDTDWHVARLYDFCRSLGAELLVARFSRYVIDLNRPPDDAALYPGQLATGLCPERTFAGDAIYAEGSGPDAEERTARRGRYWQPYHDEIRERLHALRDRHGYALLWDAHSIASRVPSLFEGELPALNIGTNGGTACGKLLADAVAAVAGDSPYSSVIDGRFRGGYITRHYGAPAERIHALQLEIAQRAYMDETSLRYDGAAAAALRGTLEAMLEAFVAAARELYGIRPSTGGAA